MKQSSLCPSRNELIFLWLESAFPANWRSEVQWCFSFDLITGSCFQGIIHIAHIKDSTSSDAPQDAADVTHGDSWAVSSCQMSQHLQQPYHSPVVPCGTLSMPGGRTWAPHVPLLLAPQQWPIPSTVPHGTCSSAPSNSPTGNLKSCLVHVFNVFMDAYNK